MKVLFKRGFSVFLALTIILSSALVGLNEVDFGSSFAVEANAEGELNNEGTDVSVKNINETMYVVQEGVTCNRKITYVIYLKAGVSVGGAVVNVQFDENALEVDTAGAYTVRDDYGDDVPKLPGVYETGLRWDATDVYSIAFAKTNFITCSEDTPFIQITFDIKEGYEAFDFKFTCLEFLSDNSAHNVSKSEGPLLVFEETVNYTDVEHNVGGWIEEKSPTVFAPGSKYRRCIVCGETVETIVLPQLLCQEPELISVVQNDDGLLFNWGAVQGADSYMIYRKSASDSWQHIADVNGKITSYTDKPDVENVVYYYTVCAVNEAGHSSSNNDGIGCEYHIHNFGDWEIVTPATCTDDGVLIRVCDCGGSETEIIDALGHDYSTEWTIDVEATCTEAGSKSYHCSRCDDKSDVTVIPAIGHNYSDWTMEVEPTCIDEGVEFRVCSICSHKEYNAIPALDHDYSDEWMIDVEATCTEDGSKSHHCLRCGEITDVTIIEALGHSYSDWVIDSYPTCTQTGSQSRICSNCDEVDTETIEANGHSYSSEWTIDIASTCTEDGSKSHHCTVCGDKTDVTVIEAIGHNYSDWVVTSEPTCTENGSQYKTCSVCGDVATETIEANGHNYSDWVIEEAEDCVSAGVRVKTCVICGDKVYETISATGHTEVVDAAVEATCTETGLTEGSHCSVCNAVIKAQETVPAKGHTEVVDAAVDATCTETGLTEGSHCSVCNAVIKAQETVPAKGHTSSDWIIDKEATCTESGSKHKECTVCKVVLETVEILATGHTAGDWKTDKEATVYKAGKKVKKCTVCGETVETGTIKQLKCDKPSLKKIENTADGVKLTWDKVEGADKYEVYYRKGSKGKYTKLGTTSKNYVTHKKAKSGNKYYYVVKAINEAGASSASGSKSIYYLADPTLKTPKSTKSGIVLKWNKIAGADGYMVYRKTGSGSYSKIATVKGNSKVTYTDKKAKKGKTYTYKVKAYKSKTSSALSNAKKIKDKY